MYKFYCGCSGQHWKNVEKEQKKIKFVIGHKRKRRRIFIMKWLQKLGKALMLPVACLPICGILMGIGYLLCPATMQGGGDHRYHPYNRSVPC